MAQIEQVSGLEVFETPVEPEPVGWNSFTKIFVFGGILLIVSILVVAYYAG